MLAEHNRRGGAHDGSRGAPLRRPVWGQGRSAPARSCPFPSGSCRGPVQKRSHGGRRALRHVRGLRLSAHLDARELTHPLCEGLPHCPLDGRPDRTGLGKADLGLGRVDVHVHQMRRHLHEDERLEAPGASTRSAVGLGDRLRQRAISHGAAVHVEAQRRARRSGPVGARHEPAHRGPVGSPLDRHQVFQEPCPEDLVEAWRQAVDGWGLEDAARSRLEKEPRPGSSQRQERDSLRHVRGLGGGGAKKLAPGGNRTEQVSHLHRRAPRVSDVADVVDPSVADRDFCSRGRPLLARAEHQLGDGGDRRQRFPTEAVRGDGLEVVERPELRGGVALERQLGVAPAHALAIVAHADEPGPSLFDLDVHAARPGVERVLDELLDDGPRPLDDLAGRDLVDEILGKPLDGAQCHPLLLLGRMTCQRATLRGALRPPRLRAHQLRSRAASSPGAPPAEPFGARSAPVTRPRLPASNRRSVFPTVPGPPPAVRSARGRASTTRSRARPRGRSRWTPGRRRARRRSQS